MADETFPFRRATNPLFIPCGLTPVQVTVDTDALRKLGVGSFLAVNKNNFWVRFRGSGGPTSVDAGVYAPATATTGFGFPPGFVGVFSTRLPLYLSAIAIDTPAFPLPADLTGAVLEVSYGSGA